jgi:hypothetical protein
MYTYGIIALWIVIVIFYFLALFGRISSFLLNDIPLVEDGCIRNLYQLRQANLLNLSHATQACPNAIWVHLEDSDGRKRTLMIVKPGSDAGVTLLFNKDGQLIGIVGDVFHLWSTPHEYIQGCYSYFFDFSTTYCSDTYCSIFGWSYCTVRCYLVLRNASCILE